VAALGVFGTKPDVVVSDLNAAVTAVCGKNYGLKGGKQGCNLQVKSTPGPPPPAACV